MKDFEIEKSKLVGVKYLWKIGKVDVDKVTFAKYGISRMMSMMNENNETIVLGEMVGEEIYRCYPSVIQKLSGRTGEIIKGFTVERKGKVVRVDNIIDLEI